ncbi:ScyD/ScyE family protein [Gramella sp. MT6]|uniref:ScyD/ScyE family protein n=1 Tax=Gramella sp. MT6 TaxID=2705471 RepID=UPI001C5F1604|nr:ScyD/ScyE family protein [Gramella sp. MT6]QYA26425.1 ScyD/ScyE family protein [Gramella sp. MT6]
MKILKSKRHKLRWLTLLFLSIAIILGCEKESESLIQESSDLSAKKMESTGPYEFPGSIVFDISTTPDGSIMVGVNEFSGNRSIKLIKNGEISTMIGLDTETDIQGVESIGAGNAFFTTAGTDLAQNGELYRASKGKVRMVADLAKFERENDPDAFEGPKWKNQDCENYGGFSAGPQNNPYKLSAFDGETVLVADAAGNTVLQATTEGEIDWKAILTPPVENGEYMVLFNQDGLDCYVQPVPTSVAISEDGYVYVGELTGEIDGGLPIGLSRVWKFPADANNLVCSEIEGSNECNVLIEGLTSVIDVEIGPDGLLYVVEFDSNSWISSVAETVPAGGGSISAYDPDTGEMVMEIASDLVYPSAITFDKKGNLWVLENKLFVGGIAEVRMLEM